MDEIKLSTTGLIIKGEDEGWYIYIQEDLIHTGGYYILLKKTLEENSEGYDMWMENFEDVKACFEEAQWKVEWLLMDKSQWLREI